MANTGSIHRGEEHPLAHKNVRRLAIGGVVVATAAMSVIATDAFATHTGSVGKISYVSNGTLYIANPDGGAGFALTSGETVSSASFAPDGSRVAYATGSGIRTKRADASGPKVEITGNGNDRDPFWSAGGQWVYFSRDGSLVRATSDGSFENPLGENTNVTLYSDTHPSVSDTNEVIFQRDQSGGTSAVYRYDWNNATTPQLVVSGASQPDFSPDGTRIAYIAASATGPDLQVWIANADGSSPAQLTTDASGAQSPSWSPDGTHILYTRNVGSPSRLNSVNVSTKAVSQVVDDGHRAAWQPLVTNEVDRVWGQDAIGTAIAASQWNYADFGNSSDPVHVPAKAVVLSRSDQFYDALAGSALAVNKQAPLLITPPAGLDPRVEAEIKRVLGTSGTVYLLGGTAALSSAVENRLTSLGYSVDRRWGATAVETAIAIDDAITTAPQIVIVSTGAEFYDALAAGAAAGATGDTVIVLSWGDSMPVASANYLNHLTPQTNVNPGVMIVGGGGPGARAIVNAANGGQLPSWPSDPNNHAVYYPLIGNNAKDTALLLAKFFFAAPPVAAVATSAGWYDALTGGAMIGLDGGPLLLTDPSGLYGPLQDYLSANSGGMWNGIILGGTAALPDSLKSPIGNAISAGANWWTFNSVTPSLGTPGARSALAVPGAKVSRNRVQQARTAVPGASVVAPTKVTR